MSLFGRNLINALCSNIISLILSKIKITKRIIFIKKVTHIILKFFIYHYLVNHFWDTDIAYIEQ